MRPRLRPRLRSRLTLAFSLAAALTAVSVAVASYAVVRGDRLERATDDAVAQATFNLGLADDRLPEVPQDPDVESLLAALQRRGGYDVLLRTPDETYQTSVSITAEAVPVDLREPVDRGRIVAARRTVGERLMVVVGGEVNGGAVTVWFFFPLDAVVDDLDALRRVLLVAALVAVVVSALIGAIAARGLLRPVARARDAARRLAAGKLETRLPVDGRDEFAELSSTFNTMAEELDRTLAGHRRFVADVSHELRTPVTALAAAADVLEGELPHLSGRARRAAELMLAEAGRLRTLVEDLMEISRIDAGAAVVERDLVDLQRLLRGAVAEHGWGAHVRTDDVVSAHVEGDRRRLDRIFVNLLDNALRHGRPPVEVAVTPDAGVVHVDIRDHGPGIAPDHLPHVFDRFYKADAARARTTSSGLGLAIAQENALLHGGRVAVDNAPGGGACFRVTLPAAVTQLSRDGDGPVTPVALDGDAPRTTPEGTSP